MDSAMDETAGRTVDELERRLMRIKYVLAGFSDTTDEELHKIQSAGREQTVAARLTALEHALARLSKRSPMVQDAMKLYKEKPGLFQPEMTNDSPWSPSSEAALAMVMAQASLYSTASTDLSSISDIPIPAPETSIELMTLKPRTVNLDMALERQARDIAELRERTAVALWWWYKINIIAGGECWAEWEERLAQAERTVTRLEKAREQEE